MSLTIAALILFGVSVWLIIYWMSNLLKRSKDKARTDRATERREVNSMAAFAASAAASDTGSCGAGDVGASGSCDGSS